MALPPSDIEPSDLFMRLISEPHPSEVVDYPRDGVFDAEGKPERIRIVGLGAEDIEPRTWSARAWVKQQFKMTDAELETEIGRLRVENRTAQEILAEAIQRPNPIPGSENTEKGTQYPKLFYGDPANVAKFPPREIGILWALWNLVQNRIAPSESNLQSPEEVEAWVKVLTEGARPFGFFHLDLPRQEALLSSLLRWAQCLLSLLNSPRESWPDNWESTLADFGIGTDWCISRAADSTRLTDTPNEGQRHNEELDVLSEEEAERKAREMLRVAARMADDTRE